MSTVSQYKRTEVIGRGKFGVVYKGYNKQSKQLVAIKVLNLDTQEDEVADVQQEIRFLTDLKTVPNVTHYYGSILNGTKLWIIMDYCAGGSVRTLLKAGVFEERYIAVIVRELLTALQAVHKLGVIHRDLKAANILITNEGNVQLCDFGVAAKITSNSLKRTTMAGTPYWMAPEVIREGDQYNSKADIWSLGITVYEIATGNPPYCDKDAMWAMQMISKSTPPRLEGREYSVGLKEFIALCLDESPEERPSADDLQKCKLMKFYRSYPTSILKEVISRYLLWRDHNSSRESMFLNLNDDLHQNNSNENDDNNNLQMKWDFDSLSSREYIMDNDISMDKVNDFHDPPAASDNDNFNHKNDYDYDQNNDTLNASSAAPNAYNSSKNNTITWNRLNGNAADSSNNVTYQQQQQSHLGTVNETSSSHKQITNTYTNTTSNNEIPKSLMSLFEGNSPEVHSQPSNLNSTDFELPSSFPNALGETSRVDSPTIEIPDMDNLANFGSRKLTQASTTNPHLPLNRPPALHHTQSASANLESRSNTSTLQGNRARKPTISNTAGSTISNLSNQESHVSDSSTHASGAPLQQGPPQPPSSQQQQQQAMPHTPPYTNTHAQSSTPSPAPPPSSALLHEASQVTTNSPSKSMRALQSNSNPLLQPINLKLANNDSANAINTAGKSIGQPSSAPPVSNETASSVGNAPSSNSTNASGTAGNTATAASASTPSLVKPKRGKPSLHIQMPTPSTTINSLAALTNNNYEHDNSNDNTDRNNVNQFGVNLSQFSNFPMTMTPVAEKENPAENGAVEASHSRDRNEPNVPLGQRYSGSISQQAPQGQSAKKPATLVNGPTTAPITGSNSGFNLFIPRTGSLGGASPTGGSVIPKAMKFPAIPAISPEFFMDSTPKDKLVSELDNMIKLFNQGLDALEDSI